MSKRNNKKLLKIRFSMNNLHSFFQRELGFSFIEVSYIKNALLRIRVKKNYPDRLIS